MNDIGRRIFGEHYRLIAAVVLGGIAIGVLVHAASGRTYTASARLVLDTADPKSRTESQAIADMAKGLATSPAQVRAAIARVGVDRDPVAVAKNDVGVTSLGTSAVLELSVSDRDRRVAAALANALAQQVIDARVGFSNGRLQQALTGLQGRIDGLNAKIAAVDVKVDALSVRLAGAGAGLASELRAQRDQLQQSRDLYVQQRSVTESERVSLIAQDAIRPDPEIISRATVPAAADSSRLTSYVALGVLLGLILGIAIAAILELIRPTLVGGDAIARQLGIAFLGALPKDGLARQPQLLSTLRARLRLAADAAEARTIGVIPVSEDTNLVPVAHALARDSMRPLSISQVAVEETPRLPGSVGLVAVGPNELQKEQALEFAQFLSISRQPVLGLITYDRASAYNEQRRFRAGNEEGARAGGRSRMAEPVGRLFRRLSWR